jgi:hypothetical protein
MDPDLKILIMLIGFVCLLWAGGIGFICWYYKTDCDCPVCGDEAGDCPFCRKVDDTLPREEIERVYEELKKSGAPNDKKKNETPIP